MTCNMGRIDRIVRAIIGVAGVALGFYFKTWWGLFAIIPLLTAAIGFCPLYVPFKISTLKKKKE
jgi:hypothetical protein